MIRASRRILEDCYPQEYPTPGRYCAIGCCGACCCGQIAVARAMAKDLGHYIFCDNLGGLVPWHAGKDETWSSRGCTSMPLLPKAASRDESLLWPLSNAEGGHCLECQ